MQSCLDSSEDIFYREIGTEDMTDDADFAVFVPSLGVEGDFCDVLSGGLLGQGCPDAEAAGGKPLFESLYDVFDLLLILPFVPGEVEMIGIHIPHTTLPQRETEFSLSYVVDIRCMSAPVFSDCPEEGEHRL